MENFDLRITSTDSHNMQVAVSNSPAGEVAAVEVDVSHFSLLDWVDVRDAALREIAAEFTAQAMPDAIWRAWRESWTAAGDAGLRLRIRCEDADSARIPWELLYDAERNYFLAHDPRSPVVRYLEGPIPDTAKPIDGPLRVILSCASPANEEALQVTKELDGIQATLSKVHQAGDVEISRLDDLNLDALDKALVEVKPHVFHFSGHGVWDEHTDSGYLILDDGEGGSTRLPHTDLAMLLRSRGVALVVLNACESAMGDRMWDGLAQSLVLAGVPAVVAMQMTVTDGAAIAFGGSLYTALVNGYGLEHAVTLARQTVALQPETVALPAEWLVPLLFMRTGSERSWLRDKPDEQTARTGGAEAQVIDQRGADISVREDHVDTGGGTYIAGNVSVAGNYGATPEQYTDMFTRVFTLMGEIPQARSQLQDERTMLNSVRQQLGPLVQYKEAHDILQQMDSGYQIIYSLVYEGGELLPESQVRWPSLKRTCADLQLGMQRLRQTTSTAYFGSDLADSRRDLEQADADMQRAFAFAILTSLTSCLSTCSVSSTRRRRG